MQLVRWGVTVFLSAVAFGIAWRVAEAAAGLDAGAAIGFGTLVATLVLAPLTWWASKTDHWSPLPLVPVNTAVPETPANDPRRTRPQIVIGDVPGEAVAWQDRVDALDRLTVVASSGRTAVVCAVTGQRGIGKTQLAAAYARMCVARGWPVVVWIVAETNAAILAGLDALAAAAGVRPPDADPADAAAAGLAWLRVHPGPCLLVYDNAVDVDLIRRWAPSVGSVQTVVTTTDLAFDSLGVRIDVDLFTEREAVSYLRERTGLADDDGARLVADKLGRLPLALSQAGAVIGGIRRYPTYGAYLGRLGQLPIGDLLPRVGGDPYPRGTAEAILISLEDLATVDADGTARQLLDHLAVLAPSGVDGALLRHLTSRLRRRRRRLQWRSREALGGADPDAIRALLAQRSLTTPTVDHGRTVVHRLVQRVVRERCHQAGGLDPVLTTAVSAIEVAAKDIEGSWDDRALLAEYIDHADALWTNSGSKTTRVRMLSLRGQLLYLLVRVHNLTTAIAAGPPLVADNERMLGPNHPETLSSRHNLADAYRFAGRLDEAIDLYLCTLGDRERVLGLDHPDTLTTRSSLAYSYRTAGRLDEAIELHKRTLADRERVLGPDHPDTFRSRNNLAGTYRDAGRLNEAIELYRRTLADRERVLGPDHPDTLMSRSNLALGYRAVGRLDEAIELHERTLADRERVLGPDHPDTFTSRNNLAVTYRSVGRVTEAIELHERILVDRERVLGPGHPDTLRSLNNLAATYRKVGRVDEAIELHERTLADRERVLGPDHPSTLRSRHNLAEAYREAGRWAEAVKLHERALADRERVLGPEHPDTLSSRKSLAEAYREAGR